MSFAVIVIILFVAFGLLDGAVRIRVQQRRTGDSGVRRPTTSGQWWARGTWAVGILLPSLIAPIAELIGLPPLALLDHQPIRILGVAVASVAVLGTFGAQMGMGASWRTTIDPTERPALVTTGPFRIIRNPVYTMVTVMTAGLSLAVPNLIAVTGLAAVIVGSQLQVRLIEEPYLHHIHGSAYTTYTAQAGRFLPGIGRRHPH